MKQFTRNPLFACVLEICAFILFSVTAHAATYTVTTTADDGAGSLRAAVAMANSTVDDDIINFSIPSDDYNCTASGVCTITLTSAELVITSATTAGALTITNSTGMRNLLISGNNRNRVFFVDSGATLTIDGVTVEKGSGTGTTNTNNGGGIFNDGTLTLTNSTIRGNRAAVDGGGILNKGTLTLTNSTVSENTVVISSGGGILNTGTATLINSTISGNIIQRNLGGGGGIYNSGTLNLTSVTVTNNRTLTGNDRCSCTGGIDSYFGTANLNNTIVAGNTVAHQTNRTDFFGVVSSGSYNLIGNNSGTSGITNGVNGNQVGTPTHPIDPRLAPLVNNGGATQTHALMTDSPAIDKGSSSGLNTDQRGLVRPVDLFNYPNAANGNGADIGAFELQTAPTAASVTISGRAITSDGRGLFNALVALTNENGETRYARTSISGRYRFNDVAAGSSVVITIVSKRYSFAPQVLMVTGEALNVDFLAQEGLSKR